jgi:predicted transcriptional regulator
MLTVADIMSRDVVTLDSAATSRDAATLFGARGISGAPVMAGGRVVGVLSKTDLVREADPNRLVREMMTPLVRFVRPEQPARAAVDLMLATKVHRLLVLDATGGVAGVVTPADVLRAEREDAHGLWSVWPHADAAHAIPEDCEDF